MTDKFESFRKATEKALFETPGATSRELRQAVAAGSPPADLATLIAKIESSAFDVTDHDIDSIRSSYTEDQLFEIILAAAFGSASERLAAARAALEEA